MMLDLKTVNDVLVRATGRGDRAVMLGQDAAGDWKPITSAELYGRVRALADVLRGWGLGKGDRVAIISENRWEWPVTDFATLAIGSQLTTDGRYLLIYPKPLYVSYIGKWIAHCTEYI